MVLRGYKHEVGSGPAPSRLCRCRCRFCPCFWATGDEMQERWASFAKRQQHIAGCISSRTWKCKGILFCQLLAWLWEAECSLHVPHGGGGAGGPHCPAREVHARQLPSSTDGELGSRHFRDILLVACSRYVKAPAKFGDALRCVDCFIPGRSKEAST